MEHDTRFNAVINMLKVIVIIVLTASLAIIGYRYINTPTELNQVPEEAYFKTCSEIASLDELLDQLAMGNTKLDGPDEDSIPCNALFEKEFGSIELYENKL